MARATPPQKSAPVPPAPPPTQVLNGKKVFIANAGEENLSLLPIGSVLSGSPDRVYNQFYGAVQTLGRYELVSAPADADLIFEIGFAINGGQLPEIGHLRLSIRDPKTDVLLWTFVEYAQTAVRKGNRDKNLDQAMRVIVNELMNLVSPPGAAAKP